MIDMLDAICIWIAIAATLVPVTAPCAFFWYNHTRKADRASGGFHE